MCSRNAEFPNICFWGIPNGVGWWSNFMESVQCTLGWKFRKGLRRTNAYLHLIPIGIENPTHRNSMIQFLHLRSQASTRLQFRSLLNCEGFWIVVSSSAGRSKIYQKWIFLPGARSHRIVVFWGGIDCIRLIGKREKITCNEMLNNEWLLSSSVKFCSQVVQCVLSSRKVASGYRLTDKWYSQISLICKKWG